MERIQYQVIRGKTSQSNWRQSGHRNDDVSQNKILKINKLIDIKKTLIFYLYLFICLWRSIFATLQLLPWKFEFPLYL